jgi:CRISPR/Cas system-associated endonuclease Cas1
MQAIRGGARSGKDGRIARAIVAAKVKAEGHEKPAEREFLATLRKTRTTDAVRHIEAQAAQVWWGQWADFEMRFTGPAVAAEWRSDKDG